MLSYSFNHYNGNIVGSAGKVCKVDLINVKISLREMLVLVTKYVKNFEVALFEKF